MKAAAEFWLFMLAMVIGAVWIGVILVAPSLLVLWLTDSLFWSLSVFGVLLAFYSTLVAWEPFPRWARWLFWPFLFE